MGVVASTSQLGFKPKLGVLENYPKNEVNIKKFPHKMSIKPTIFNFATAATKFSETGSNYGTIQEARPQQRGIQPEIHREIHRGIPPGIPRGIVRGIVRGLKNNVTTILT